MEKITSPQNKRSTGPIIVIPDKNSDKIDPKVDQDYNRRVCAAHNSLRKNHGVPPVGIDWALANSAQKWAESMHSTGILKHTKSK